MARAVVRYPQRLQLSPGSWPSPATTGPRVCGGAAWCRRPRRHTYGRPEGSSLCPPLPHGADPLTAAPSACVPLTATHSPAGHAARRRPQRSAHAGDPRRTTRPPRTPRNPRTPHARRPHPPAPATRWPRLRPPAPPPPDRPAPGPTRPRASGPAGPRTRPPPRSPDPDGRGPVIVTADRSRSRPARHAEAAPASSRSTRAS